jgi:hypothetical protein
MMWRLMKINVHEGVHIPSYLFWGMCALQQDEFCFTALDRYVSTYSAVDDCARHWKCIYRIDVVVSF